MKNKKLLIGGGFAATLAIAAFLFIYISGRQNDFLHKTDKIQLGMSKAEVDSILSEEPPRDHPIRLHMEDETVVGVKALKASHASTGECWNFLPNGMICVGYDSEMRVMVKYVVVFKRRRQSSMFYYLTHPGYEDTTTDASEIITRRLGSK